jgi:hypothetical protein
MEEVGLGRSKSNLETGALVQESVSRSHRQGRLASPGQVFQSENALSSVARQYDEWADIFDAADVEDAADIEAARQRVEPAC